MRIALRPPIREGYWSTNVTCVLVSLYKFDVEIRALLAKVVDTVFLQLDANDQVGAVFGWSRLNTLDRAFGEPTCVEVAPVVLPIQTTVLEFDDHDIFTRWNDLVLRRINRLQEDPSAWRGHVESDPSKRVVIH